MTADQDRWRQANWPTPQTFQQQLKHLYLSAEANYDHKTVPTGVLIHLIKTAVTIYTAEFPATLTVPPPARHLTKLNNPPEAYQALLVAFAKSLIGFTQHFPDRVPVGEQKPPALFNVHKTYLLDALTNTAFEALALPFNVERTHMRSLGLFEWDNFQPYAWFEFDESEPTFYEREPIYGDQYERRQWSRAKREFQEEDLKEWKDRKSRYDREHKEARKLYEPSVLMHTPYWLSGVDIIQTPVPFDIPEDRWFEACWIVAPQGSGKTNLLRHLILNRLADDATIIIMDAKGNLLDSFTRLAELKDRLVVLELTDAQPLAINPLAGNSIETLEYLFGVFNAELSAMQGYLFRNILFLLQKLPNPTMEDFWHIITHGWKEKYANYVALLPERIRTFFEKDFNTTAYRQRCGELSWRLGKIIDHLVLGPTFTSKHNKIDMAVLLNSGNIVCIDNNYDRLGPEASEFIGRLFLALIWQAGRAKARKKPVYVFIDEAHCTIRNDPQISDMITQLRSSKISLTFAHQGLYQIDNEKVRSALALCAIKFSNASGEATDMARYIEIAPETLKSLDIGQMACWVKGLTKTSAVTLTVPYHSTAKPVETFTHRPTMGEYEYRAFMLTMYHRFGHLEAPPKPQPKPSNFDVEWVITISPLKAQNGCTHRYNGLAIKIPPQTRHGARMRIKNKGAFKPDGTRGDAYVTINVPQKPSTGGNPAIGRDWD